jgi:hypothetical protein
MKKLRKKFSSYSSTVSNCMCDVHNLLEIFLLIRYGDMVVITLPSENNVLKKIQINVTIDKLH